MLMMVGKTQDVSRSLGIQFLRKEIKKDAHMQSLLYIYPTFCTFYVINLDAFCGLRRIFEDTRAMVFSSSA